MKTITPGHRYELESFEPPNPYAGAKAGGLAEKALALCYAIEGIPSHDNQTKASLMASDLCSALKQAEQGNQVLQFIEKGPDPAAVPDSGKLVTINNGTTNEEILAVLIDRLTSMNAKFPCRENSIVVTKLEESLMWLEKRTRDRAKRGVEGKWKA